MLTGMVMEHINDQRIRVDLGLNVHLDIGVPDAKQYPIGETVRMTPSK